MRHPTPHSFTCDFSMEVGVLSLPCPLGFKGVGVLNYSSLLKSAVDQSDTLSGCLVHVV